MIIDFGDEVRGKTVSVVVLKHPEWIKWALDREAKGRLKPVVEEIERLINIFDRKPFTKMCFGTNSGVKCANRATYCTVARDNLSPY